MIIEDGKGSGKVAAVGDDNRLFTRGTDEALEAAVRGDAYVFHIDAVTISAADYLIALIINKDANERDMVVTKCEIGCRSTDDESQIEVNLGGTFTATVANSTAVTPYNVRSGCKKAAGGIFYKNDGADDMTTESNAYVGYSHMKPNKNTSNTLSVEGGWIIPYGNSISISANKDDVYYGSIHFYYRS